MAILACYAGDKRQCLSITYREDINKVVSRVRLLDESQ